MAMIPPLRSDAPVRTRHTLGASGKEALASSDLARLCTAGFMAYCSYAVCRAPLLPLFARDLGAGPSLIGIVVGASTLTGIFVKMPAGALSDVFGRRALLLAGALVFALMPFTYLGASTLATLIMLRVMHGCATAIFGPVASATVSDLAPVAQRGARLGTYATAQGAGQAIGPVLAGYLIAAGRFDVACIAAGVIGLAAPLIVGTWSPPVHAGDMAVRWPAFRAGLLDVLRHRLILATSVAHAAQFVLNGALSAFLPLYARDVFGLTTAQLGWLFAAHTVTTLAIRPLIGSISDRVGRRGVIVAGLTMCSMAVWAMSVTANRWMLAGAVVTYAAGVATTTAATSALITDVSRRSSYGTAHGVFGTIYDIGDAAGPISAGFLVAAVGYAPMFRTLAVAGLTMAAVFAVASRPGMGEGSFTPQI
jgi:DHA1 family multidrug resistance protein-like MFS transporter